MKKVIKMMLTLLAALVCGGAWASQLYVDKLDAGTERIPNGTYGEGDSSIVVPGYGIKATTYSALTEINHKNDNPNLAGTWTGSLQIAEHTISAWFKISALPTDSNFSTIYADRSDTEGAYGGYKLGVNSSGKLKVGRINGGNYGYIDGVTYNSSLQADTWYYITVSMVKNSDNCQPAVYVNGVAQTVDGTTTTFAHGMNGDRYLKFMIGANVSAAGLYADNTAITDASVIKNLAVSPDKVSIIHLAQLVNKADGAVETTYDAIESSITINEGKEFQIVAPPDGGVMDFSSSVSGAGDLRFIGLDDQRTVSAESDLGTTAKTVLNNVKLDAIIPIGAKLSGSGIGSTPLDAHICNVVRGSSGITFQAQVKNDGWIKTVKVLLAQSGEDVTAKVAWSRYAPAASYPLGADLEYKYQNSGSYDIRDIVLNVTGGINVTATGSGNNTNHTGATIVDNCFLKTSNLGALSDTVQAVNGAEVALTRTNGAYNNSGYGQVIEAQEGSRVVLSANDFVLGYDDKIFCNGGTVEYVAGSWAGKNLYIGNIELSEGGVLGGSGRIRIGNYCNSTIKATGNATILNAQLQPYGSTSSAGKTGTFDVADGKTLTVYANVVKASDQGWDKLALKKIGSGTVEFRRSVTDGTANTETLTIDEGVVIANGYDSFCQDLTVNNGGAYSISAATSKTISGAGEIWMTANNLSFESATLNSFTGHIVIKSGVTYTCAPSDLPAKLKIEPNGTWAYTHEGKSVTIAATDATKSLYYENGAIKIVNAEVTSVDVTKFLYPGISSVDVSGCTALAEVYVGSSGDFTAEFAKVTGVGNDVTIVVVETPAEYANGALTISNVPAELVSRIKVKRPGLAELVTPIAGPEANTLTINDSTIKISGAATSFDVTFNTKDTGTSNGHIDYQCLDYVRLQYDSTPTYTNETQTAGSKDMGVYLKHHPYVHYLENNNDAWFKSTDEITLAVVGQMPSTQNTVFLHMGRSATKNGLFLATGTTDEEVKICYNKLSDVVVIDTLKVPNASTARHTYVITKRDDPEGTENRKTTFEIWLDGELINTKKFDHFIVTGGIQVGKPYGSNFSGWNNVGNSDSTSYINLIRVYDRVISEAEILKYSDAAEYPYNSPQGTYQRNFTTDAGQMWKGADNAWTSSVEGEESGVALPLKGLVTANFAGAATITVNQTEPTSYEKLILNGASDGNSTITFEKGEGAVAQISTLNTTINTPIVIKEGTLDLSGGPTKISARGHVTFDYSSLTAQDVLTDDDGAASFKVTGLTQATEDKFSLIKPTDPRLDVSLVKHNDNNSYYVEATVKPVYLRYKDSAYSYVLEGGNTTVPLLDGDTIIIEGGSDKFYGDIWQVGRDTALPDLSAYTLKLNSGMNFKRAFVANQKVELASGISVFLYGDIGDNVSIGGSGTLFPGYKTNGSSVGDGTVFNCPVEISAHELSKGIVINGAVTMTNSLTFAANSTALIKLGASSATLTLPTAAATGKVVSGVNGSSVKQETNAQSKIVYSLVDTSAEPIAPSDDPAAPAVVIEDVGTGIAVEPGAKVVIPTGTDTSKVTVKYGETTLTGGEHPLVAVTVNQTTGAIELTTTDSAKPAETAIAMSTPTEGEGEEATDKVQFTITNPIPGLFYEIVSGDSFDEHGALVVDHDAEKGTSQATTSAEAKTVSIPMEFSTGKKVKYYKVSVKATK